MNDEPDQWLVVTEDAKTLPAIEILTGRGFITGKSGSGKSNTASVIAEELLNAGLNLLIIDTEGEYYGLKEEYELIHAGAEERCDMQLEPGACAEIAQMTLQENMPVVFDVSMYDLETAADLIQEVTEEIFELEREFQKPFLLLIEEVQEYLPQTGGKDDLANLLLRIAKRGRKRGLGLCGISQRPSAVDKDFITQCDWMVWHRLTWDNDLQVVSNVLGKDVAEEVSELEDGEAYLMTDWDDVVERVKFRRKKTFDAGATPGLDAYTSYDQQSATAPASDDVLNTNLDLSDGNDVEPVSGGEVVKGNGDTVESEESVEIDIEKIDRMNEEELREALKSERRRSQILEDEITELRSVYRQMDSNVPSEANSPFGNEPTTSSARRSVPGQRGEHGQDLDSIASVVLELGYLVWFLLARGGAAIQRLIRILQGQFETTPSADTYPITTQKTSISESSAIYLGLAITLLVTVLIGVLILFLLS